MIDKTLKDRAIRYINFSSFFLIPKSPKINERIPKITK